MTEYEQEIVDRWMTSDEGKTEMAIQAFSLVANDLKKGGETRDGAQAIRNNMKMIIEAKKIIDSLLLH